MATGVVYHCGMLNRCLGFFVSMCHDITILCGAPSSSYNERNFLFKFNNLVLELIYHLPRVLSCKMGGCLLSCPVYDLLNVHWHMGFFLWVGLLLILRQAGSHVCRYL